MRHAVGQELNRRGRLCVAQAIVAAASNPGGALLQRRLLDAEVHGCDPPPSPRNGRGPEPQPTLAAAAPPVAERQRLGRRSRCTQQAGKDEGVLQRLARPGVIKATGKKRKHGQVGLQRKALEQLLSGRVPEQQAPTAIEQQHAGRVRAQDLMQAYRHQIEELAARNAVDDDEAREPEPERNGVLRRHTGQCQMEEVRNDRRQGCACQDRHSPARARRLMAVRRPRA